MPSSDIRIVNVRFEHYQPRYAFGVQVCRPRISWQFENVAVDFQQAAYEIEVSEDKYQRLGKSVLVLTKVESSRSSLVEWPYAEPLASRQQVHVRVRCWDITGNVSLWSEPATIRIGLLDRSDWTCQRITAATEEVGKPSEGPLPEQLFRKPFSLPSPVARALLYIAVQGVYEVEIDGQRVGDDFLAPGWTVYSRRIQYQTYDVTELLASEGLHCMGIRVAEGWFCGRLGFGEGHRDIWGTEPSVMSQLEILLQDGSSTSICSDASWMSAPGPIVMAELYDGEKYDATREIYMWSQASQDYSPPEPQLWHSVAVMAPLPQSIELVSGFSEPTKRLETIQPLQIITTGSGKTILDFGQNLVGYMRMKIGHGTAGHKISMYFAEVLDQGELGRRQLRAAKAHDEYTFKGAPEGERWEPRFTFHGFQYCQVDNWPADGQPLLEAFEGVVCNTDMAPAGDFTCSNDMLNKLYANSVWSMRGNFLSLPTDCPQRDERLGWTGDLALFGPTATKMYNCTGIIKNWLVDVGIDQAARGGIPALVTPNILVDDMWGQTWPCAIWHDVIILAPWALYEDSGDPQILLEHYDNMTRWTRMIPRDKLNNSNLWDPKCFQLGDWLDPTAPPHEPALGQTEPVLVANAFLIHSLDLMAKIASTLGNDSDADEFLYEAAEARRRFSYEYIAPSGRISSDSQTAYSLAICFDLYSDTAQKLRAGQRLARIVRRNGFRIGTGFAGTPFILEALASTNQTSVAFGMLLNRQCPSWLYPVSLGATTLWERWNSMLPEGSINPGEMTSFNHYCFGAVATFLYERVAGLQRLEPGWTRCRIAPLPGGGLSSGEASHHTPFGRVACAWRVKDGKITVDVEVPPVVVVEIVLPLRSGPKTETPGAGRWSYEGEFGNKSEWPIAAISPMNIYA